MLLLACESYPFRYFSEENGEAGSPSPLNKLQTGLLAHPYRTATGSATDGLLTTTVEPSIIAVAGANCPSLPATSNPVNSPPLAISPFA